MTEGEGASARQQGQVARKRSWQRGPRKRTLWSRMWDRTGLRGKTLWDWLQLLIVPFILAIVGFTLTSSFQDAQQQRVEAVRAQEQRLLEEQRAQTEALQRYLDVMKELLLERHLRSSQPDSSVRAVAQVQTTVVLEQVDSGRRRTVLRLLHEAHLIDANAPIIHLDDAHLAGTVLVGMDLSDSDLSNTDLRGTNLRGVDLYDADLRGANLNGAKGWTEKQLSAAKSLEGATMPNGQVLKSEGHPDGLTFEEWLKSKGRGEDGENSGP